jgi:hypothetical protein
MVQPQTRQREKIMGFREDLQFRCLPGVEALILSVMDRHPALAQKHKWTALDFVPLDTLTRAEGRELRELWECGKTGNLAVQLMRVILALDAAEPLDQRFIQALLSMPGFLTAKEQKATEKLHGRKVKVKVWRGGSSGEVPGLSWTTDVEVAKWFAARGGCADDRALFQGVAHGDWCWLLGGPESEVIVTTDSIEILDVTPANPAWAVKMEWETRKAVKPTLVAA